MASPKGVVIAVRVKPGSAKGPLVEASDDGSLIIYVRERAVDGRATEAVERLLAAHLGVPRSRLELVSGAASRLKRFRVTSRAGSNPYQRGMPS